MSMGGGGKSSTSSTSSPYAGVLAGIGQQMWNYARPTVGTLSSQTAEALQTGGVNARIPSINASVSAARESASQTNTDLRQTLAKSNLAGTPFGDAVLAQEEGTANQAVADIPGNATNQFIAGAVPTVVGEGSSGAGAIGTAAGIDKTTTSTPSFWQYFLQGLNSGTSAFGAYEGA